MSPKIEKLIEMCVENGVEYGWRRAHKNTDEPTEEAIKREIDYAIRCEFYEWFNFEEYPQC